MKEEGRAEGREEERINTEHERKRADNAEHRANKAENDLKAARDRIAELEAMLAGK